MLYAALHTVMVKKRPFIIHRSQSAFVPGGIVQRPGHWDRPLSSFIIHAGGFYKPERLGATDNTSEFYTVFTGLDSNNGSRLPLIVGSQANK